VLDVFSFWIFSLLSDTCFNDLNLLTCFTSVLLLFDQYIRQERYLRRERGRGRGR
jgi:hypothetical protein